MSGGQLSQKEGDGKSENLSKVNQKDHSKLCGGSNVSDSRRMTDVNIQSFLTRAWRERWTEVQFSINLRKSFDAVDSDVLLNKLIDSSLTGSSPNNLYFSYFVHEVNIQTFPLLVVMKRISQFANVSAKFYCILSLVKMVQALVPSFCARSLLEPPLDVTAACLETLRWLFVVEESLLVGMEDEKMRREMLPLAEQVLDVAISLLDSRQTACLLLVAKNQNPNLFNQVDMALQCAFDLRKGQSLNRPVKAKSPTVAKLASLQNLPKGFLAKQSDIVDKFSAIGSVEAASPVLAGLQNPALLNPLVCTGLSAFVLRDYQKMPFSLTAFIKLAQQILGLDMCQLLKQLLHSSLMGVSCSEGAEQQRWLIFSLLRLPQLMLELQASRPAILPAFQSIAACNALLVPTSQLLGFNLLHAIMKQLLSKSSIIKLDDINQVFKSSVVSHSGADDLCGKLKRQEDDIMRIMQNSRENSAMSISQVSLLSSMEMNTMIAILAVTENLSEFVVYICKVITNVAKPGNNVDEQRVNMFNMCFTLLLKIHSQHPISDFLPRMQFPIIFKLLQFSFDEAKRLLTEHILNCIKSSDMPAPSGVDFLDNTLAGLQAFQFVLQAYCSDELSLTRVEGMIKRLLQISPLTILLIFKHMQCPNTAVSPQEYRHVQEVNQVLANSTKNLSEEMAIIAKLKFNSGLTDITGSMHLKLEKVFKESVTAGFLKNSDVAMVIKMFKCTGIDCFLRSILHLMFSQKHHQDISRSAVIVLSLFLLDLPGLSERFFQLLPQLVHYKSSDNAHVLALLTVSLLNLNQLISMSARKRKLSSAADQDNYLENEKFQDLSDAICDEQASDSAFYDGLYQLLQNLCSKKILTQSHGWASSFLLAILNSASCSSTKFLEKMPLDTRQTILHCFPKEIDPKLLLKLCDLSKAEGQKLAINLSHQLSSSP